MRAVDSAQTKFVRPCGENCCSFEGEACRARAKASRRSVAAGVGTLAKAQATFASSCGPNSHIFDLATRSIASNNGGAEIPAFTKAHASADSCCAEKPSILARLWTARPSNKSSGILNSAYSKPPRSAPCAAKTACFAKAHAVIDKFCAENVATLLVLETSSPRAWNRAGAKWPRREKDQAMTLPAWASNVEAREAASSATASKRFGASMEAFA
mmetsp:Transcript_17390/g.58748  ORF Transcript_17390/g.58748 Transcript_17390/m.58748 type:complete len:214 (+) Transcript_17390:882-1523(+)